VLMYYVGRNRFRNSVKMSGTGKGVKRSIIGVAIVLGDGQRFKKLGKHRKV